MAAIPQQKDDLTSDSSISDRDEGEWEDAEPDEESIEVVSLFDDTVFGNAKTMLDYCKERYNFDFISIQKQHNLDFYQSIKLVNYIRASVKQGNTNPDVASTSAFADDRYLQPVLEDDALLFSLDELVQSSENAQAEQTPETKIAQLEAQLSALNAQFSDFRQQVDQTLERRWAEGGAEPTVAESSTPAKGPDYEGSYFESYSYNAIHEEMLKDKVRTDAYRDFIYENRDLFHGKTVLDVGCGTGILSMFCAKAGAARVIAVDNSDIIDKARANVFANKLDGTITCLRGKIEELTLPVEKVDIIVSEWMGYCLLFEAMLDSVLWARDRYLKPEGLMVPSHTRLHITPFADEDFIIQNIDFWRDVYGFNMTAMQEKITEDVIVRQMSPNSVVGTSCAFGVIDLHDIKVEDLEFVRSFEVEINGRPDGQWGVLDGWLIYFDTFFLTSRGKDLPDGAQVENWPSKDGVAFTTGPSGKETHWKSGVMVIDTSKTKPKLAFERGQTISGHIAYRKGKENSRGLEIDVQWLWTDGETSTAKQTWLLK